MDRIDLKIRRGWEHSVSGNRIRRAQNRNREYAVGRNTLSESDCVLTVQSTEGTQWSVQYQGILLMVTVRHSERCRRHFPQSELKQTRDAGKTVPT
jgi:hypothetical protein